METRSISPHSFSYAIEIKQENEPLDDIRRAALEHLRRDPVGHELVIETPARMVVKFTSELAARRFYCGLNGRYVGITSRPFELRKGE